MKDSIVVPPFITVTGVDERTDIAAIAKLDAEVGILLTGTPEGRNRYPRREWVYEAAQVLPRVAIHVCGSAALGWLISGAIDDLVALVDRVQVNGVREARLMEEICWRFPHQTIINQYNPVNARLLKDVCASNHALLSDASGGQGISPSCWLRPDTEKPFGFAGGLGPENLAESLAKIRFAARHEWWVDMEGKLRVDDWFSIPKATEAVEIFHASVISKA